MVLEIHCFSCHNIEAIITSSTKVYDRLTTSESFDLSQVEFEIPDWIFRVRSSEWRVSFHGTNDLTNGSIVSKVFWNELVVFSGNNKSLR